MKNRFKRVYVEITNRCNKNCKFCVSSKRNLNQMSVDEFKYTLKQIKPYTDYIFLHVLGEPLLHSEFDSILAVCDEFNVNVNITTNGSLLKKRLNSILNHKCVRQINISLHSLLNNDDYLEDILYSTKQIIDETKIYVVYRFWTLSNYKLKDNQLKIIDSILNYYNCTDKLKLVNSENNIELQKNLYLNKSNLFEWPSLESKEYSDNFCYGLKTQVAVLSDGTVVPCCLDSEGIINLGNIFKTSFKDIINSKKSLKIIKDFNDNKCSEELCKHCSFKNKN